MNKLLAAMGCCMIFSSAQAMTPEGLRDTRDSWREARTFHIMFSSKEGAEAARAILAAGPSATLFERFKSMARADSKDPGSAAQGGDMDVIQQGSMDKAFDQALFALAPRTLSPAVKSAFGWHLIYVTELRETPVASICAKTLGQAVARAAAPERKRLEASAAAVADEGFVERVKAELGSKWGNPLKDWNGDLAYVKVEPLKDSPGLYRLTTHSEHVYPVLNKSPLACRRSARHEFDVDCSKQTTVLKRLQEFEGRGASGRLLADISFPPPAIAQKREGVLAQLAGMACGR